MKRILMAISVLMLVLSLAACNADNLGEYKKALERTEQITKGQMSGELSMALDFKTDGLSVEDIKELNYFKDMRGSFSSVFDKDLDKGIYRNYMNLGGLGFDYDVYANGNEIFMKLPVAGKYMKFYKVQDSVNVNEREYSGQIISEETMKAITEKWVSLMKEEDVLKGKEIILTTPDGEVKTKKYTIALSSEQIKALAADSVEAASRDESLKRFYDEYAGNVAVNNKSFEEMIGYIKSNIQNYDVENFKYTALVDIDGYIVSTNIVFNIRAVDDTQVFRGFDYSLSTKNWDINKEQTFDFPELTEENTVDSNKKEEMPDLIKNLFKNKN